MLKKHKKKSDIDRAEKKDANRKTAAGRALARARWQYHTAEPTQPRRLKMSTIERVQFHAAAIDSTFDGAIVDLLDRAAAGHP